MVVIKNNRIKGILFDAEDVIYYRDKETLNPVLTLFRNKGYSISLSAFKGAYEKEKLNVYKNKISKQEHLRKTLEHLNIRYDDSFVNKFIKIFDKAHSNIKTREEIISLFSKLKQRRVKIGIITDTFLSEQKKWEWFRKIGIGTFIDAIICSSETGFTKDHKEAYEFALKKLDLKPHEVLFVGHQEYEMRGAREAGIKSISLVKGVKEDTYVENINNIMGFLFKFS